MADIRPLKKPDKARVTLSDDSIIILSTDLILEVSQSMSDVQNVHGICGISPLFGPCYCSDCEASKSTKGCGKWFIVFTKRGELCPIEVHLKDGGLLYPKSFELIEDNGITFIKPDRPKDNYIYA